LCVVVASVVQDEEVVEWSEASTLIWPVQPRLCSRSGDNGLQDSPWSSSFMPSPHETTGSSRYLAHDDVPAATDGVLRRWRSMSPSAVECLLTLVSTM
jgi:hypothetical protein